MSRMRPLTMDELSPELKEKLESRENRLGFVANSGMTMIRRPAIWEAMGNLGKAVFTPTENVPVSLRAMVGHMASRSAGCLY